MTLKGHRLLSEADIIIYAGSLVPKEILSVCRTNASVFDSAGMNLDEVTEVYKNIKIKMELLCDFIQGIPLYMEQFRSR